MYKICKQLKKKIKEIICTFRKMIIGHDEKSCHIVTLYNINVYIEHMQFQIQKK